MTDFKFDESWALSGRIDLSKLFQEKLLVCMELELTYKKVPTYNTSDSSSQIDKTINYPELYGIIPNEYYCCPVCHTHGCWGHFPEKMIYDVHHDGGGQEFRIYGSNITTEEFIKRLPWDNLRKYFKPSYYDGLHTHALLIKGGHRIPAVIPANLWNMYRYYFLGWTWMFGNYKGRFLRGQYAQWHYIGEDGLNKFRPQCWGQSKNGLNFGQSTFRSSNSKLYIEGTFDVEMRTADSTLEVDQLCGLRAMTRAITLRAVDRAKLGGIQLDNTEMTKRIQLYQKLEPSFSSYTKGSTDRVLSSLEEEFMKSNAIELFEETAPYLSEIERQFIKGLIEMPVRDRPNIERI